MMYLEQWQLLCSLGLGAMAAILFIIPYILEGNGGYSVPGTVLPDWPGCNGDNSVPKVDLGDILLAARVQQTQGRVNAAAYNYTIFRARICSAVFNYVQ
jgi:hypothetical protein